MLLEEVLLQLPCVCVCVSLCCRFQDLSSTSDDYGFPIRFCRAVSVAHAVYVQFTTAATTWHLYCDVVFGLWRPVTVTSLMAVVETLVCASHVHSNISKGECFALGKLQRP